MSAEPTIEHPEDTDMRNEEPPTPLVFARRSQPPPAEQPLSSPPAEQATVVIRPTLSQDDRIYSKASPFPEQRFNRLTRQNENYHPGMIADLFFWLKNS